MVETDADRHEEQERAGADGQDTSGNGAKMGPDLENKKQWQGPWEQ